MATNPEQIRPQDLQKEVIEKPQATPEKPEPIEANFEKTVQQAETKIGAEESRIFEAADLRLEKASASVGLDQQKAQSIFTAGGFSDRIKNAKEKIAALTQSAKNKIKGLGGRIEQQPQPVAETIERTEPKTELVETKPKNLGQFVDNVKRKDELMAELGPEEVARVADSAAEVGAIADTAQEIANESKGSVETVGPERRLAEGESILDKENPYQYMAAVRVSNNLPVFENGKLVLKTAFDITKGKVPRPTLHFTVNCRVGNNDGGNWDDVGYSFVMPIDKIVEANGKPYAFGKDDTFWATARGLEMPSTSKIIYRADKKDDPEFRNLMEQCKQNKIPVEFIESPATDDTMVEQVLEKGGYGDYIQNGQDKNTVDDELSDKMGVIRGGYGNHTGSAIWKLEKAFLNGQPNYEFTDEQKDNQWKRFIARATPFGQMRQLADVTEKLPNDVREQFEAQAKSNLNTLLTDKAKFEQYAQLHAESEETTPLQFKTDFYEQAVTTISEQQNKGMVDFLAKNPEMVAQVKNALLDSADKPEARVAMLTMMQKDSPVSAELKALLVDQNIQRGGFTTYQLLEYFPQAFTPEQQQTVKETILANMPKFNEADQGVLQSEAEIITKQKRDYFTNKYGTEFVEYFDNLLKK